VLENYTDRALTVLAAAEQEAAQLNHSHIGDEHLLLGLLDDGGGIAAQALANAGITPTILRFEIKRLIKAGPDKGEKLKEFKELFDRLPSRLVRSLDKMTAPEIEDLIDAVKKKKKDK